MHGRFITSESSERALSLSSLSHPLLLSLLLSSVPGGRVSEIMKR